MVLSSGNDNCSSAQQSSKLNDDWASIPDNEFAAGYFDTIGWNRVRPTPSKTHTSFCQHFYSSESVGLFDVVCNLSVLQEKAKACELCGILQSALNRRGLKAPRVVNLRNEAAHVGLKDGPNLLSLYCEPGELPSYLAGLGPLTYPCSSNGANSRWWTTRSDAAFQPKHVRLLCALERMDPSL